jgi:hypothetical protein
MYSQMMLPENSISLVRGSSKTVLLTILKPDGCPYDLTGGKLVLTIKEFNCTDIPLLQKLTSDATQGAITKPREGIAEFYFRPVDTNGMVPKAYSFDVWLITASGDRYVVVPESSFVVSPGVTYLPT